MNTKPKKHNKHTLARTVAAAATAIALSVLGAMPALSADEVALWHCTITVNSVGSGEAVTPDVPDIASGAASAMESLNPLVLEFDVNQNIEPIRDTLKASYTWTSRSMMALEGARIGDSEGHGQGTSLEDWEVVLSRHFNPIDCDSFFFVDDEWERILAPEFPRFTYKPPVPDGSDEDPAAIHFLRKLQIEQRREEGNKLDFRVRAEFPVTIISNDYINGATFKETSISSFEGSGEVDYEYRMANQSMRPEPVSGVYGTGVILPEVNISRHTIDLEMTRKPVELSLSAEPGKGKGSSFRFKNKITVDGVECSRLFKVHRLERDWFLMGDWNNISDYVNFEVVTDWHDVTDDGNLAAERDVSFESFFPPKSPRSAWGDRVYIAEFLDTVEGLPELGFLYHFIALQTREEGKNVSAFIDAFAAHEIDAEKWCELFLRKGFLYEDLPLTKKTLARKDLP